MEQKEQATLDLLRKALEAGVTTQKALGVEVGIPQSALSAMLRGREYLGPVRAARIRTALLRLVVDPDHTSEPDKDKPVELRIRHL